MTQELLERLFPDVMHTPEGYEAKYPLRNLPVGAMVTRFSPSPTGFLHIGGVMTALFSERLAHQAGGTFFLRIEDTDKNREQAGAVDIITNGLEYYGVHIDEGINSGRQGETLPAGKDSPYRPEKGSYGPYTQSARKEIYRTFIKHMVANGHAYPCFVTPEELEKNVEEQEAQKLRPGYYGKWAVWRDASEEKISEALDAGKPFAIRMRSTGSHMKKVLFHDEIKGDIHMPENDLDIVILKSSAASEGAGLPTYHLAHVVDDHLMRVTHVIRGDEWFPSLPIHIELFKMFGWEAPKFCHVAPIVKMDGASRRKLSKRKDPEASVEYYEKEGYPASSVQEFLLNLLNSNYEDWRRANPTLSNTEFKLSLDRMSVSGALFDMTKFNDVSKETISRMTAEEVYSLALGWAEKFDSELAKLLQDKNYALAIFGIERTPSPSGMGSGGEVAPAKSRKDIAKWSDVKNEISYFFELEVGRLELGVGENDAQNIVNEFLATYSPDDSKEVWLDKVRNIAEKLGYARDTKTYKANPEKFKGALGQVTNVLRLLVTGRSQSPDLYEVMKVLGKGKVVTRLSKIC